MSRRTNRSRYAWLLALVLWMACIFYFSHQRATESGEISMSITYHMAEGWNKTFSLGWQEGTLQQYARMLEHPIRKAAHMTEYAVLACILLGNCMQYPLLSKRPYLWAEVGAGIYAATDEFHQLFIEGRSGEWKDVGIDSVGAFLGLCLAWIALGVWNQIHIKFRKR